MDFARCFSQGPQSGASVMGLSFWGQPGVSVKGFSQGFSKGLSHGPQSGARSDSGFTKPESGETVLCPPIQIGSFCNSARVSGQVNMSGKIVNIPSNQSYHAYLEQSFTDFSHRQQTAQSLQTFGGAFIPRVAPCAGWM